MSKDATLKHLRDAKELLVLLEELIEGLSVRNGSAGTPPWSGMRLTLKNAQELLVSADAEINGSGLGEVETNGSSKLRDSLEAKAPTPASQNTAARREDITSPQVSSLQEESSASDKDVSDEEDTEFGRAFANTAPAVARRLQRSPVSNIASRSSAGNAASISAGNSVSISAGNSVSTASSVSTQGSSSGRVRELIGSDIEDIKPAAKTREGTGASSRDLSTKDSSARDTIAQKASSSLGSSHSSPQYESRLAK